METFKIKDGFIQLNQLIKAMGWADNGAEANKLIDAGKLQVNGVQEHRKRNKLVIGDEVRFKDKIVTIE